MGLIFTSVSLLTGHKSVLLSRRNSQKKHLQSSFRSSNISDGFALVSVVFLTDGFETPSEALALWEPYKDTHMARDKTL